MRLDIYPEEILSRVGSEERVVRKEGEDEEEFYGLRLFLKGGEGENQSAVTFWITKSSWDYMQMILNELQREFYMLRRKAGR